MRQDRLRRNDVTHALFAHYGENHAINAARLTGHDIAISTFAGAGKAILAVALRELGLDYVDALKESVRPDGTHRPVPDSADYRNRLGTAGPLAVTDPDRPRIMKTNLPIDYFRHRPLHGLWILIRDPRDSLYSAYRLVIDVLTSDIEVDPITFDEWLTSDFFTGFTPLEVWSAVYAGLPEDADDLPRTAVTRFEDLKRDPYTTLSAAFDAFGIEVASQDLDRAIEMSSFERMRAHEDSVLRSSGRLDSAGRMVRKGRVDEWKEWMTPELRYLFADEALVQTAGKYGYDVA